MFQDLLPREGKLDRSLQPIYSSSQISYLVFSSFQILCLGSSNELAYDTDDKSEPEDADKDGRNHISPVEDDSGGAA